MAGFIALGGGDERIREAARLTRMYPQAKLVITGYGPAAVRLVQESGLAADRVIIEGRAQNTYENAVFTAQLVQPNASQEWILVTSASHMARAIGCFRRASFAIEAWPVPNVLHGWSDQLSRATHEWMGLVVSWLRGRTDALFPAGQPPLAATTVAAPHRTPQPLKSPSFTSGKKLTLSSPR